MDDSSTDKQIFEFSKCPSPVEFRAAIYIVKCFRLKGIAEHVDHSTASLEIIIIINNNRSTCSAGHSNLRNSSISVHSVCFQLIACP